MDNFTVWVAWQKGDAPRKHAGPFREPAEAADAAERLLGVPYAVEGETFAEIRFNGDSEPHTVIFLMEKGEVPTFGVWNTASAMWPIFYPESPYGIMLDGDPFADAEDDEIQDDEGRHKKDEDSDKMKLDGMDDEPEADDESEDDTEEFPDDEKDDDDEESPEDENTEEDEDDESDDEGEEEAEEEDESDDSEDDDRDDSEDDDSDENDRERDEEADEDDEGDDESDSDGDGEDEKEMPRLNIFAKMRGPKGWRKRAEAEELNDRNVFGLKIGVLDPDAETPGQQEKRVVAHVEFIESDESRANGILKLRLPDGITLDDFTQTKAGVISVTVPYPEA